MVGLPQDVPCPDLWSLARGVFQFEAATMQYKLRAPYPGPPSQRQIDPGMLCDGRLPTRRDLAELLLRDQPLPYREEEQGGRRQRPRQADHAVHRGCTQPDRKDAVAQLVEDLEEK